MAILDKPPGIRAAPHEVAAILIDQLEACSVLARAKFVKPAFAGRGAASVQTFIAATVFYLGGTADTGHEKLMNYLKKISPSTIFATAP